MDLVPSKISIVHELFVRTADENYITARWCAANGLAVDFLWLSVHALEKYMKAALLINEQSSKSRSHNIVKIYEYIKHIAGDLLPCKLEKPEKLKILYWNEQTPEQFLKHLYKNGNAHNRYAIYGHIARDQDLHMLDSMVFFLRRLAWPLDEGIFFARKSKPSNPSFREIMHKQPDFSFQMSMPLDAVIRSNNDSDIRRALLNLNFAFAPDDFNHETMRSGKFFRETVLLRRIMDPLESDNRECVVEAIEIANWLIKNVKLPTGGKDTPEVIEEIKSAVKIAKSKHGII